MDNIDPTNGDSPIDFLEEEPKLGSASHASFDAETARTEFLSGASQPKEVLPVTERLTDSHTEIQSDADREKAIIADMLKKFPEEQRHLFDGSDGIECVYLGEGEISPELAQSAKTAKEVLKGKFGEKLGDVFQELKVYYVRGEIEGAGWAYSHANAIVMDFDKNSLSIEEAEKLLGPEGHGLLEPGDWQRVVEDRDGAKTISGETTLVHEIGHILQAKTGSIIDNTENSPTKYGRSKEWEDYAESFLYYCYDKPMNGSRTATIENDVALIRDAQSKIAA